MQLVELRLASSRLQGKGPALPPFPAAPPRRPGTTDGGERCLVVKLKAAPADGKAGVWRVAPAGGDRSALTRI